MVAIVAAPHPIIDTRIDFSYLSWLKPCLRTAAKLYFLSSDFCFIVSFNPRPKSIPQIIMKTP
jgi:hypothetical protein